LREATCSSLPLSHSIPRHSLHGSSTERSYPKCRNAEPLLSPRGQWAKEG
jgi:hypothetical protein